MLLSSCDDTNNKKVGGGKASDVGTTIIENSCASGSFKVIKPAESKVTGGSFLEVGDVVKISGSLTTHSCYTGSLSFNCSATYDGSNYNCQSGKITGIKKPAQPALSFVSARLMVERTITWLTIQTHSNPNLCPISIQCEKNPY